jgi:DNA-binding CsgD family transcriptional regulator
MSPAYRGALILKHNGSMTRREDGVAGRLARAGVTEREAEVLLAVAERLRNREIAGRLHVSVRTVESHVAALLRKLGVADRAALAEMGAELGRTAPADALLPVPLTSLVGRQRCHMRGTSPASVVAASTAYGLREQVPCPSFR